MFRNPDSSKNIRREIPSFGIPAPGPIQGEGYSPLQVTGDLKELEQFESTRSKYRLPPKIKPCILKLLNSEVSPEIQDNWEVPCIVACELRRVGQTSIQVERRLRIWQKARPSEVQSAVRVSFEKGYEYGCPTLERRGICLYKSRFDCPWYAQIPRKGQASYRERDFYRFGWPKRLKPSEQCIYFAIRELEKKRGMRAGSRLFVNEREMAEVAGIDRKTVRSGLPALKEKGLISFRKGRKHKHYGIAGEVRRIIPIPRPK